jgi:hypothetical protein
MFNKPINPQSCQTDVMRGFFISEFEKDLENQGIDTVCFMGYGYNIEEVKVGGEFYFSYLYYGKMSDIRRGTKEECLRCVLIDNKQDNYFDRYKILQKHKYFYCSILDDINKKIIPIKQMREYVRFQNLRTNKIQVMSEGEIFSSSLFCWVSW